VTPRRVVAASPPRLVDVLASTRDRMPRPPLPGGRDPTALPCTANELRASRPPSRGRDDPSRLRARIPHPRWPGTLFAPAGQVPSSLPLARDASHPCGPGTFLAPIGQGRFSSLRARYLPRSHWPGTFLTPAGQGRSSTPRRSGALVAPAGRAHSSLPLAGHLPHSHWPGIRVNVAIAGWWGRIRLRRRPMFHVKRDRRLVAHPSVRSMFDESHERWPTPSAHLGTETLPTTLRERRPVAVGVDTHARSTVRKTRRHASQEECPIRLSRGAEAHDSTYGEPDRGAGGRTSP